MLKIMVSPVRIRIPPLEKVLLIGEKQRVSVELLGLFVNSRLGKRLSLLRSPTRACWR